MPFNFIIIDDDRVNNMICCKIINTLFPQIKVKTFTDPEEGLAYIKAAHEPSEVDHNSILFLDINMPTLTGWDVLDIYNDYPDAIKKQFKIFMLSSSVDVNDLQRATNHPLVTAYIEKPLTQAKLKSIL